MWRELRSEAFIVKLNQSGWKTNLNAGLKYLCNILVHYVFVVTRRVMTEMRMRSRMAEMVTVLLRISMYASLRYREQSKLHLWEDLVLKTFPTVYFMAFLFPQFWGGGENVGRSCVIRCHQKWFFSERDLNFMKFEIISKNICAMKLMFSLEDLVNVCTFTLGSSKWCKWMGMHFMCMQQCWC